VLHELEHGRNVQLLRLGHDNGINLPVSGRPNLDDGCVVYGMENHLISWVRMVQGFTTGLHGIQD
jgi:hypothetical protein